MKSWKTMVAMSCCAFLAIGCGKEAVEPVADVPVEAAAPSPEEWCRVCEVDKGERIPEYLPSRLDVERDGQTYRFCNDGCRAKFDAQPEPYLLEAEPGGPAEPGGTVDAADGDG
jgi:YHS domain-containing protein